jgi:hypothetical protein
MPRRFEIGTLLILELDNSTAPHPVYLLAHVIRIVAQAEGNWFIGCAFVGEVSGQEFAAFRAESSRPPKRGRRAWVRIARSLPTLCCTNTPALPGQWAAELRDLSPGGVGLVMPRMLETGTILNLSVWPENGQSPGTMQVRVMRQERQLDGRWLLGCELCPNPAAPALPAPGGAPGKKEKKARAQRPTSHAIQEKLRTMALQAIGVAQDSPGPEARVQIAEPTGEIEAQVYETFRQLADQFLSELRANMKR